MNSKKRSFEEMSIKYEIKKELPNSQIIFEKNKKPNENVEKTRVRIKINLHNS